MSRTARLVLALLLFASSSFGATHAEQIDALLRAYNEKKQFNGSALVAENGNVILKKGYGFANMEWQVPNTPDTKFRLGSITKEFTSMVIMQLVNEGKIALDERITTYLPDYRKDTGSKVTVRNLLTHTSGIPSYTSLPGFFQNQSRDPYKADDFVKKFTSGDLEFTPGSKFSYDNSGYFLLGAIIEHVTGKTYEQALRERIFDPLGMTDSGYDHSDRILPKRAAGYAFTPDGYQNAPYLDMTIPFAAGALYSTVEDLFKWDRALYTDKLLPADLKTVMFTPFLNNYAFGWGIGKMKLDDKKTEVATISHNGGINGFATVLVRMPDKQDFVALLDNTMRGDKLDEIKVGIVDVLHDIAAPPPKVSIIDELMKSISTADVQHALARYRELKASDPDKYDFRESELNNLGYVLLQQGRAADAVEIFKLNVEAYPKSANVYDSLGEAYAAAGNRELAIVNYRKSIELDPKNTNAVDALKRLQQPAAKVDAASLDKFVGTYELAPGFDIAITKEGATLYGQATGQAKFALTADSLTEFHLTVVKASITFAPDGSSMVLHQNGRDMTGRRIK